MRYFLFLICVVLFSSCYYDNFEELYPGAGLNETCDTAGTISFATKVLPIMTSNCGNNQSGCHSSTAGSGINLSDYSGVSSAVSSGLLLGSIRHDSGYSPMPKNSLQMNDCNIKTIEKWVLQGALNN